MKKKLSSLLLFCIITTSASVAQVAGWHYQASIDSIKEAGFYNLQITPDINAHLKLDYNDLRIVNDSGKWVPHLLRLPNSETVTDESFTLLPIIKNESTAALTEIIIKADGSKIANLLLKLKNTAAERFCTFTGSDDANNWFIINDSILIRPGKSNDGNTATFNILFPSSNYKFYKLSIYNKGKAPFNIIEVGTSLPLKGTGSVCDPVENPATSIIQKDSGKLSYIKVTQTANFHFDEILLKTSAVKYFSRTVDFYVPLLPTHSFKDPGELRESFTVSNNSTLRFKLSPSNAATFYLIIHNEDNLPLKAEEVKTFNSCYIATVYFEKDVHYKIIMSNATAHRPTYDLQQLNISNKESLPVATAGNITAIPQPVVMLSPAKNNKWLIWLVMGVAAALLSFFTYKLLTEMKKSKAEI